MDIIELPEIEDTICWKLTEAILEVVVEIEQESGKDFSIGFREIENAGYSTGYLPEMRDLTFSILREMGINVTSTR